MKVFFDHQVFLEQSFGGVSNYFINLTNNFTNNINPLIVSPFYKNNYLQNSKYVHKFLYLKKTGLFHKYFQKFNRFYFERYSKLQKPDLVHYTYFNEKIFYNLDMPMIITEYDLIKEKYYKDEFKDQINFKKKLFNKLEHIFCISNNTKKDLLEFYNLNEQKISVTHLAVKETQKYEEKSINLKPFILYVGRRSGYKNFINAIKAYAFSEKLLRDFDFVCFGGEKFSNTEKNLFREINLPTSKIHYFQGNQYELNFFYKKAEAFIFPSFYEGFGIPLLEAMNMETPVLCSNTSCFPEIAGNGAVFFDPNDISSIKHCIEKTIYDDVKKLDLKKKGNINLSKYSWKKCAIETEAIYKKLF